jgi:hypothetical protein
MTTVTVRAAGDAVAGAVEVPGSVGDVLEVVAPLERGDGGVDAPVLGDRLLT